MEVAFKARASVAASLLITFTAIAGAAPTRPGLSVNIRRLGAVGDGVTNDTSAFQLAAQLIRNAGGGEVVIPEGLY